MRDLKTYLSEVLGSLLDFYDIFTQIISKINIKEMEREIELIESVNATTSGSQP